MRQPYLRRLLALLLVLAAPPAGWAASAASSQVDGHWEGVMDRNGATMAVRLDFSSEAGTTSLRFSSDLWGVMDWPAGVATYAPPKLQFALEGDRGAVVFEGEVSGENVTGGFTGSEGKGRFALHRGALAPAPYARENVTFHNGGVTLCGTLLMPRTPGPHPAIVLVHGSQAQTRWGTPFFVADRFARRGVAALVYDKRGSGASSGDWKTAAYEDIAEDALAGVHLLQQRPDIRPAQVGAYGHSEGGAMVALMAARSRDVAFIISADGTTGPSYKQDLFRVRRIIEANGFSPAEITKAMAFYSMWLQVARSGRGRGQLESEIPKVQQDKWFDLVAPPPPGHWAWTEYRKRADFDSLPSWTRVRVPVLLAYGELDENVPAAESIERIDQALRAAGNPDYTEILAPRAQHNLTVHPGAGPPYTCPMDPQVVQATPGICPICKMALEPQPSPEWWHAAPGLTDLFTAWVLQRVAQP